MKYSFCSNMRYTLSKAMKFNKKLIPRMLVYTISSVMLPVLTVYFPKLVIDEAMGAGEVTKLTIIMAGFLLAAILLSYVSSYLQNRTYGDFHEVRCYFMQEYQQKCFGLGLEKVESSDFLNKINMAKTCLYGTDSGFEGVLRELFIIFGAVITIAYYAAVIILFQPLLFLLLLANTVIPCLMSYRAKRYEYSRQEELSFLSREQGYINELMSEFEYGKEIRLYNMSGLLKGLSGNLKEEIQAIRKKILTKRSIAEVSNLLVAFLREGLVYLFLIAGVLSGQLSVGDFTLYTGIFVSFSSLMTKIIESLSRVRADSLLISDYRIFMDTPDEKEGEELSMDTADSCSVDFENISFSYPGSGRMLFDHLNVHIEKGEKIAIVGMNGAGKTTFIKLLCRLLLPTEGEILLNGVNINEHSEESYAKLIATVFQDFRLFAFSIRDNIDISRRGKDVRDAIRQAGIEGWVKKCPAGEQTQVTRLFDESGVEPSGGEGQKLAIARAIYRDAPVMILDEPTAALDPYTEYEIYQKFDKISNGKTVFYISHRLGCCQLCDRILVFADGQIAEQGSHEELKNAGGVYSKLWNAQAKFYVK